MRIADKTCQALALAVILLWGMVPVAIASGTETNSAALFDELISLNPRSATNLIELAALADRAGAIEKQEAKAEKRLARDAGDLKDASTAELRRRFTGNSAKHNARAFSAIGQLAQKALRADDAAIRSASVADILEIQAGLRASVKPAVPEKLGVFTSWIFFFNNRSGTIGRGDVPAANITAPGSGSDGGRSEPRPSTFWTRPAAISQQDLYSGFGRGQFPRLENSLCNYDAPKTSSGTHAGFDVECHGERFKIKFGDLNSEPFTARIFYALGYHVDPTDYAPKIEVRYDRRMLREFHLRKPLDMQVTPLGIHVSTIRLQQHFDPFAFITTAVFKDGRKIPGQALKQMLFINPNLPHPEDSPGNFRNEVEAELDYVVMAAANVQPRDGPTQSIGSWEFGGLGHENLRELRGAGLLAGWLAWFDSRADNTKLRVARDVTDVELLHFISDLGGGMGAGKGFFSPRGEDPNDLTWTFTTPEIVRGPGRMTTPFRIDHFKPTVPTPAFAEMTADDARWMTRLIGQLTENQLRAALIASGYDNAESRLYLEKLIGRRDQMICDLRLENEIPLLRPTTLNRDFSYDPSVDGPFEAFVNGTKVTARKTSAIIVHGKIIQR